MQRRKKPNYLEHKTLSRKWLFLLIVLPWFLATLILMGFETRSFRLKDTWGLTRDQRRIYFVKKEFNAIGDDFDDDYFELINRARFVISPDTSPFQWYTSKRLSKTQNARALMYSYFWLTPSVCGNPNDKVIYKIYYQREPDSKKEKVVEKINGEKPSYITKVTR